MCCCLDKKDPRNFKNNVLKSAIPSEPENIYWENIQYSSKNRAVRKFCSYFIWIILFAVPVIIIVY